MKRVFIVHGWGATPESDFIPWLKGVLESKGFWVKAPAMPNTKAPTIGGWVSCLSSEIGKPDEETYLIGHSMGCQAIVRYLAQLAGDDAIGGTLLVAPFVKIIEGSLDYKGRNVLAPWIETPIDWKGARAHCRVFVSISSDNDPYIDVSDSEVFKEKLGSRVIVIPGAGHFRTRDGYKELHAALNEIEKMMKSGNQDLPTD